MCEHLDDADTLAQWLRQSERLSGDILSSRVLALALLEQAEDSRTAARLLGTGHALVLRAVTALCDEPRLIAVISRDMRTMRTFYKPSKLAEKIARYHSDGES